MNKTTKSYSVDWDGTIVDEGLYPAIGEPKPNAIKVIKRLIEEGNKIIIWTCRGGENQAKAIIDVLNKHGVYDFVFNTHLQETLDMFDTHSPKVYADYYIDDRSIYAPKNGVDWFELEKLIFNDK